MTASRSDALVLFGVTGDLAHKMIFPALYAMAERGALTVPVIDVALPNWSLAHLHKRVADSIKQSGGIDNQRALDPLPSLLSYVKGDYDDEGMFTAIKKALGSARRLAHYSCHPALALREGHQRARRLEIGRACVRHCRKTIRTRPDLRPESQSCMQIPYVPKSFLGTIHVALALGLTTGQVAPRRHRGLLPARGLPCNDRLSPPPRPLIKMPLQARSIGSVI
jgi:hypothetical protein